MDWTKIFLQKKEEKKIYKKSKNKISQKNNEKMF